jgi:hypothetical protein
MLDLILFQLEIQRQTPNTKRQTPNTKRIYSGFDFVSVGDFVIRNKE